MTDIAREIQEINAKVRGVARTRQRYKPNKQQVEGFRKAVWGMARDLAFELSQPLEYVLNDIDFDEIDNYDDELTQDELQSYVRSIHSDIDVSVCKHVFTTGANVSVRSNWLDGRTEATAYRRSTHLILKTFGKN